MTIRLKFTATDPRVQAKRIIPYDESIGADSRVIGWFTPKASRVSLSGGRLASMSDRSALGRLASQATAGNQPLWSEDTGPNGAACLIFDNARQDRISTNVVMPTGGAATWTKAAVVKVPNEPTANVYRDIMSGSGVPGSGFGAHRMAVRGTSQFAGVVGASGSTVSRTIAQVADAWCLVMCSWDGATNTAAMSVNGGAWTTATVSGATCTDSALNLGTVGGQTTSTMIGSAADFMVFNVAMHLGGTSNLALLALYKEYLYNAFALSLS